MQMTSESNSLDYKALFSQGREKHIAIAIAFLRYTLLVSVKSVQGDYKGDYKGDCVF